MATISFTEIQAVLGAGRIVEAGTLLTMHGENLSPEEREVLETQKEQLWSQAMALIAEGERLEQAGEIVEAQEHFLQAAAVASDFPGVQEHCKRMDEALVLANAVRLRSKRIRAQVESSVRPEKSRSILGPFLGGMLLLGLGGGAWWYLDHPGMEQKPLSGVPTQTITTETTIPPSQGSTQPSPRPAKVAQPMESPPPAAASPMRTMTAATPAPTEQTASAVSEAKQVPRPPVPKSTAPVLQEKVPVAQSVTDATLSPAPAPSTPKVADHSPANPPAPPIPSEKKQASATPPAPASPASPGVEAAASVPKPASASTPGQSTLYTVQTGDSLSKIAERLLCNQDAWRQIHALNRDQIQNPDMLIPGMQIQLKGVNNRCRKHP